MSQNKDYLMLKACVEADMSGLFTDAQYDYPLDSNVIDELNELYSRLELESNDFSIFKYRKDIIDPLWRMLIEKAIKCLRYCDEREPFGQPEQDKSPKAYGIKELQEYYNKYTEFEQILYGSSRYYRDHVVHVFRTWLSGVTLLIRDAGNGAGEYLNNIKIHEKDFQGKLSPREILSMWTIIALTHDLGYPLQTAKQIIDKTHSMVSTFISNPDISMDFSFRGVQNYMNDFIVRLMSSKMIKYKTEEIKKEDGKTIINQLFAARLQPKYYFKFQKSLERNSHGILSTIIIYKLLTYFLESDYNINEDYTFDLEDQRQFYIRREILRAIASHTCDDIYQLYTTSFSFLLRICDDTQEWGRKNITELYVNTSREYELKDIGLYYDEELEQNICVIDEAFTMTDIPEIITLINEMHKQSLTYVTVFRDGQDTDNRDFSFRRKLTIKHTGATILLELKIDKDLESVLSGEIKYDKSDVEIKKAFSGEFCKKIHFFNWKTGLELYNRNENLCGRITCNESSILEVPNNYGSWKSGRFNVLLSN